MTSPVVCCRDSIVKCSQKRVSGRWLNVSATDFIAFSTPASHWSAIFMFFLQCWVALVCQVLLFFFQVGVAVVVFCCGVIFALLR